MREVWRGILADNCIQLVLGGGEGVGDLIAQAVALDFSHCGDVVR